jgi:hypothetical protein
MKLTLEILQEKGACEESIERFGKEYCFTVEQAIKMMIKEKLYDWCNWLLSKLLSEDDNIRYAIFAAEQVIHIFDKQYPEDKRPRNAIDAAKKYLEIKNSITARAAARAAGDAAWAARAAARAARDAAWAAGAAGNAAKEKLQRKIIRYGLKMIPKGDA